MSQNSNLSGHGPDLDARMGFGGKRRPGAAIYLDHQASTPVGRGATMRGTQLVLGGRRSEQRDSRGFPSGSQYARPSDKSGRGSQLNRAFDRAGHPVAMSTYHGDAMAALTGQPDPVGQEQPSRADGDIDRLQKRAAETKELLRQAKELGREVRHLDARASKARKGAV